MPNSTKSPEKFTPMAVSVTDAVAMTGISRSKLYQAMIAGRLKSLKLGGRRLFRPADLENWLSEHEETHA